MEDNTDADRAAARADWQQRIDALTPEERRRVFDPFYEPEEADPASNDKRKSRRTGGSPAYKKGSAHYEQQVAKAKAGLPDLTRTHWLQAQFRDEGQDIRGKTRYAVKLEFTTLPLEHCRSTRIMQQKAGHLFANLSTTRRFRINLRDNKQMSDDARAIAHRLIEDAKAHDDIVVPEGGPGSLIGPFNARYGGTHTYPGEYALVRWMPDALHNFVPEVTITQPGGNGVVTRLILMRPPPEINRNGEARDAECKYRYVGTYYSPDLQARIDEGTRVKAEKAARDQKA